MTPEPFKFLPSEIIINILSKLPPRTILICKRVCKSWHHLVDSQEFVKSHLAMSVPGLVTLYKFERVRKIEFFEIKDGNDAEHHDLRYNLVTGFNCTGIGRLCGSVDGLLWLYRRNPRGADDFITICNPITREYIRIPIVRKFPFTNQPVTAYGFGPCRKSGQYKLVRILLGDIYDKEPSYNSRSIVGCHVYTLGSGCGWRSLAPSSLSWVTSTFREDGVFVNGNLHWLRGDLDGCFHIFCFDLETEKFSTLAVAPPLYGVHDTILIKLFAWGENLCLHNNTNGDDTVIWVMEEYGIVESWTKKLVINRKIGGEIFAHKLIPLNVFKDGDILMGTNEVKLFNFSNKTKTFQQIEMFKTVVREGITGVIHTPSFFSLKSFGMENVMSY